MITPMSEWLPEKIGLHSVCQRLIAKFHHRPFLPAALSLQTHEAIISASGLRAVCGPPDLVFVANLSLVFMAQLLQ